MSNPISRSRNKLAACPCTARLLAALVMGVASASVQAAPVIYTQPVKTPGVAGTPSTAGQFTAYDDFTLANGGTITDLHWHGGFFPGSEATAITSFTIQFFNDNAGQPGSSAQAAQTVAGNAGQSNQHACAPLICFDYNLDPITSFIAGAGTRYWLSIIANTGSSTSPLWVWEQGSGGNSLAYVRDSTGALSPLTFDLAFDLTGTTGGGSVPEPATLALLGLGLAGLGVLRRKRS